MSIVIFIVFLLIGGLVVFIGMENLSQQIHLQVFFWSTPSLPLGVWLIAAFLCGAILLYIVAVLSAWGDRRMMKRLRKQALASQEQTTTPSQTSSASTKPTADDRISAVDTAPMPSISSTTNTPQAGRRTPTSPLSPQPNFRP